MATGNINISYMADAVLLIRFVEAKGRLRKVPSALGNRGGAHEGMVREPCIGPRGVRTDMPQYTGAPSTLLRARDG